MTSCRMLFAASSSIPADKGRTTVVMDKTDYSNKANSPADRGRYTYHIEGQFHFGFILFL